MVTFGQWSYIAIILIVSPECESVLVKPIEMKDYGFVGVSKNTDPHAPPVRSSVTGMEYGPANGGPGLTECAPSMFPPEFGLKTRPCVFRPPLARFMME